MIRRCVGDWCAKVWAKKNRWANTQRNFSLFSSVLHELLGSS